MIDHVTEQAIVPDARVDLHQSNLAFKHYLCNHQPESHPQFKIHELELEVRIVTQMHCFCRQSEHDDLIGQK